MDRMIARLGPNGALGFDRLQWILYRAYDDKKKTKWQGRNWDAASFVRSTKAILERCIREKGIEVSPEGQVFLDQLPENFDSWIAKNE